jgi:diguanylate cyclase (GGDEF)-like protein/PAS domain S-box-containing protein
MQNGSLISTRLDTQKDFALILEISIIPVVLAIAGYINGRVEDDMARVTDQLREIIQERENSVEQEHVYFNALVQNTPLAVAQLDLDQRIISLNPKFEELFGFSEKEAIGKNLDHLVSNPEVISEANGLSRKVLAGEFVHETSIRFTKEGQPIDVEIFGIPVVVSGKKVGALGLYQDISREKEAERNLLKSEARYKDLFQNSPVSLWEEDFSGVREILEEIDFQREEDLRAYLSDNESILLSCIQAINIIDVNQATLDLYKANTKDALSGLWKVAEDLSTNVFVDEIVSLVFGGKTFSGEIEQRNLDGELFHANLHLSVAPGYEDSWKKVIVSILDITERKDMEKKLRYLSFHDSLTGLYNRAYFDQEMSRYNNSRMFPMVIAVCDLDNLKGINDTHGHAAGDRAIRTAGQLLMKNARTEDMVARIGGDEFGLIFPQTGEKGAASIQQRIISQIEAHNEEKGEDGLFRPISLSVGVVVVDMDSSMYEGFRAADEMMYEQKRQKLDHSREFPIE